MSALLILSLVIPSDQAHASSLYLEPGHKLSDYKYKRVYGNPNDHSDEGALILGILLTLPSPQTKTAQVILKGAAIALGYAGYTASKTPKDYYQVRTYVYRADKPTMTYAGYYVVRMYNERTKKAYVKKTLITKNAI